ncbi:Uncharacterized protein CTA2_11183, partial [Colletotrichum tanaceti]
MDAGAETPRTTQNSGIKARRPRAARACDLCRAKKIKCDELYPCTYCKNRNAACVYKGQEMSRRLFTPEYAIPGQCNPDLDSEAQSSSHTTTTPSRYVRQLEEQVKNLSAIAEAAKAPSTDDNTAAPEFPDGSSPDDHSLQRRRPSSRSTAAGESPSNAGRSRNAAAVTAVTAVTAEARSSTRPATHYPQCRHFLQSFFSGIHYVHPILDRKPFLDRCEELWARPGDAREPSSFVALYYSILSLGALVGVREGEPVDGVGNLQWSRRFFDEAKRRCDQLGMAADLEMVQCYFFLAMVCQNELNAHWSYMYVGLAVRTALAMGINREPGPDVKKEPALLRAESRTWWGLYSLETEISFSMGRPDTLGADLYHNRPFPVIGETETESSSAAAGGSELVEPPSGAIIKCMVDYSKIIRSIFLGIYLPETTVPRTVQLAHQIDKDLQRWAEDLPEAIRPTTTTTTTTSTTTSVGSPSPKSVREAQWMKRQRLVLTMRFLNIRIRLFGSIILTSTSAERASIPGSQEGVHLCLEATKQTIEIIYQTYQHHDFFRTWYV